MKPPRILVQLMVERRNLAKAFREDRAYWRKYGITGARRKKLKKLVFSKARTPRVTVKSLLRLAAQNRVFAGSRWASHDTETYSACGWDDYQIERRQAARQTAKEWGRAARFLAGVR